ncbi:LLM class F420-dependent oxidoreductase [Ornithinimicrobium pekingense]|uniref:LLM class F420-dependent oxidoreductase n=1 Tax=Ornithinimicrobium pekingense TaxID=384677 RepID=A0ABQ2FCF0_9MICO|nr:LLM class F420-dependent oxidoreductase [Ornithinimicrobium pekingense]GGK75321.1 LLM class F420-dependent oxidoreductase [Ornithinimicrobium pekingense]
MRLGLSCGFWGQGRDEENLALALRADELGVDVVWAAEAYGPDVVSVLAWIGARTEQIGLGAGVMQIPARTPAATAMAAAGLDSLSGGRFRLGLGVSGPQVSEGWHGVRFDKPLARTREYADIVRLALSHQPVAYEGEHFTLPLPDGPGKPLRLTSTHRRRIPLYLAAVGPRNLELAGEIADGWLGVFVAPDYFVEQRRHLEAGLARRQEPPAAFDTSATVAMATGEDLEECARVVSPYPALYVGGMGSRKQNFYNQLAGRMGYEKEAARVQELYLDKRWAEAAAALPPQFVDDTSLLGDVDRVTERMRRYAEAGISTLTVAPWGKDAAARMQALEVAVEAHGRLVADGSIPAPAGASS